MKPQPFNLDLWLHLGKPDCVWTRGKQKVKELQYHKNARQSSYVLTGLIDNDLSMWYSTGEYYNNIGMFSGYDLMLHLGDKPSIFRVKKK